jgi:hypothetical protein
VRFCAAGLLIAWLGACGAAAGESAYAGAQPALLEGLRKGFERAPESAEETRRLLDWMRGSLPAEVGEWPPVFRAYRAALLGLEGKHSWSPRQKLAGARAGVEAFSGLAEAHPESTEIWMLRYSFGSQLPGFMEARKRADADLETLVALLERGRDPGVTDAYRAACVRWILRHGEPPPALRERLARLLPPEG